MFSALKKRLTRQDDSKPSPFPSGVAAIGQAMQTKFAKGVQYNMKIIIRGERNTGKSCLLSRLQGKPFNQAYIPTQEIQAASINWNYRGGDDIVKVEVWDIVDKGQKKKTKQDLLKISNEAKKSAQDDEDGVALDADFIDVYKGTHGVIMIMDITKPWTWGYIERELPKVPNHIPVLVMANFRDMGEHRLVDSETMAAHVEHLDRPFGSAEVNFVEASLKNGFGLRYLYHFLNMPFLILQRETLLRQLEANALEIEETREVLLRDEEKEEQNYDKFLESIANRKAKTSGAASPSSETDETASEASPAISSNRKDVSSTPPQNPVSTPLPPANARQSAVTTENKVANGRSYIARVEKREERTSLDDEISSPSTSNDIHEFSPDTDLDPNFLEGADKKKRWWSRKQPKKEPESETVVNNDLSDDESDEEGGNPLVMAYQDFESEDENAMVNESPTSDVKLETNVTKQDIKDSSDEEADGSKNDSDTDEERGNPLVSEPIDIDSDNEQNIAKNDETKQTSSIETFSRDKVKTDDTQESAVLQAVEQSNETPLEDDSSDDENETGVKYEVTPDFDLDEEPALNDWLGGGEINDKKKTKTERQDSTKEINAPIDISRDSSDEETHEEVNETKKSDKAQSAFVISPDDLDMFVSEQMRKTSISQDSEETEKKKPKKKKKQGEGEKKKKKKKKTKDSENMEDEEPEKRKKKSKSKEGKKKTTAKRTAESDDYELL